MQNGSLRGPKEVLLPNPKLDIPSRSQLHEASITGDDRKLEALLLGGADRNAKDAKHGNTPLHEAAWRGHSRCVRLLCTLPKLPKSQKDIKETKIKGVIEDTRGALHSALLGTRNYGGFSPLHLAAQNGHNQSCREILLADADPDVQNNYGDTPLHTACRYGHAGATRILLSGKCDHRRCNLNGDTPLHIAVAMGRRKLTKILLEAGSLQNMKNAQGETIRDIAIRKNLVEIIDILNTPIDTIRRERDRSSSSSKNNSKGKEKEKKAAKRTSSTKKKLNPTQWSPYGCHYSPDPRDFPSPKLETLPKDPLSTGEQYFLDLAGNIRKGPIGVGNACYCAPFFRHLEERISKNKHSIKKIVERATEKIDNKVTQLALKTDDQIGELTRSVLTQRIQCEDRRKHLEEWLTRGHIRATVTGTSVKMKKEDNHKTITRCKSLELLDDDHDFDSNNMQSSTPGISKSMELLDNNTHKVIVHREPSEYNINNSSTVTTSTNRNFVTNNSSIITNSTDNSRVSKVDSNGRRPPSISRSTEDYISSEKSNVSERLEELLAKTNEIIELEKFKKHRNRNSSQSSGNSSTSHPNKAKFKIKRSSSSNTNNTYFEHDFEDSEYIAQEMKKITNSLLGGAGDITVVNPSTPKNELKRSEKEQFLNTFYQNTNFNQEDDEDHGDEEEDEMPSSSNNTIKTQSSYRRSHLNTHEDIDEHCEISEMANFKELNELKSRILNGSHWRSQVLRRSTQEHNLTCDDDVKFEIKHSDIKTLRPTTAAPDFDHGENDNENSESSDDEDDDDTRSVHHQNHIVNNNPIYWNQNQNHYQNYTNVQQKNMAQAQPLKNKSHVIDTRALIPKDAYFHELPNKNHIIKPIVDNLPENDNNFLSKSSRNRNPLPYNLNETEIMTNFTNNNNYAKHIISSQPPPKHEKLLSHRKFNHNVINYQHNNNHIIDYEFQQHFDSSSTNSSTILTRHENHITIDQAQIDRDLHNDSGYSTKMCGSSEGASPCLSGQIDSSESAGSKDRNSINEKYSNDYYLGNIGASSLV